MKKDYPVWPLAAIFFVVFFGSAGYFLYDVGNLITDPGFFRWDREHHLPHGYRFRQERKLERLAGSLKAYAQHHQGCLPPMKDATSAQTALMPYVKNGEIFFNTATRRPFLPNAALFNRRYRAITNGRTLIAFYDPAPPTGYPEVYYVTVSGHVDHVSLSRWPQFRQKAGIVGP